MPAWEKSDRRERLPLDWPQRRAQVLERDGSRCQLQYDACAGVATDVDHIVPGDDHRLTNLQAACQPCHALKSAREGVAARARVRDLRRRPTEPHPGICGGGGVPVGRPQPGRWA
ncbi:MAG: HNH endonuclease [Frankiales bacterium]|nr:HNH endonuclease [Frankiales bacterium]